MKGNTFQYCNKTSDTNTEYNTIDMRNKGKKILNLDEIELEIEQLNYIRKQLT